MTVFRWMLFFAFLALRPAYGGTLSAGIALGGEQRPEDGVHDPSGLIPPAAKAAIIREMRSVRDSSGLDLLVAVADKPIAWDPQKFADELSNRWGYHGGRALVLWIPENTENPWISIGGLIRSELSGPEIQGMMLKAKGAANDPRPGEAIRKAVVSLGEDLRFAGGKTARKVSAPKQPINIRTTDAIFILFRDSKKILAAVGLTLLALSLIGYWFIKAWRSMRLAITPRTFPDVSWKRRFGAPHAGIVFTSAPKRKFHP